MAHILRINELNVLKSEKKAENTSMREVLKDAFNKSKNIIEFNVEIKWTKLFYEFRADGFKNGKFENLKIRRTIEGDHSFNARMKYGYDGERDSSEWFRDLDIELTEEDLDTDARDIILQIVKEIETDSRMKKELEDVDDLDDIKVYDGNRHMILKW